jgi:hypothetical protein
MILSVQETFAASSRSNRALMRGALLKRADPMASGHDWIMWFRRLTASKNRAARGEKEMSRNVAGNIYGWQKKSLQLRKCYGSISDCQYEGGRSSEGTVDSWLQPSLI